jgi:release factor glutamine methyltransferase
LPEPVDVIVANLPYIAQNEIVTLAPEINNFEPLIALDGGQDGMDKIRSLLYQSPGKIHPDGCILLEIGQNQEILLRPLVHHLFPKARVKVTADLSGINRVIEINGGIRELSQVSVCNQADKNVELTTA